MTKVIKTLCLVLFPMGVLGQQDSLWNLFPEFYAHPFRTVKAQSMINAEASNVLDASTANNALLWRLSRQADLNNALINENASRVQSKNLLGVDNEYALSWYNLNSGFCKRDSLHYFVRYGLIDRGGASYSGDFFKLLGLGNKAFEGDTAFAGGLDFRRSRFDYLDFGLIKFFPNRSNLSVSVGVTRGLRFLDVQAPRLQVYTAPYGTSTDWDINVNAKLTPGNKQTLQYVNGMGAQVSADFKGLLGPDGAYAMGVHNLGFMQWSGAQYTKDTSFTYNGWSIPSLNSLNKPNSGQNAFDSISSQFWPDSSSFKKVQWLPAYLYASYTMKLFGKQSLEFRFDKVINTPMLPRVSVAYTYFFGKMYGSTRLSTGGYSRLAVTQSFGLRIRNHCIRVQLYGIQAWPMPHKSAGIGGGIGYTYILNRKL
ncbi:MAG: hypothetical protein GC180_10950 [Bacteroidetes bacterium]|nr:hypothetical protein [Bacteroidota bacterium]